MGQGFACLLFGVFPVIVIPPISVLISLIQHQRYVILALLASFNSILI